MIHLLLCRGGQHTAAAAGRVLEEGFLTYLFEGVLPFLQVWSSAGDIYG